MFIPNTQPITKFAIGDGTDLIVHSIFYTIQGEGPFAGRPAVFIRLGGCNLRCPGCDTEYTQGTKLMSVERIISDIWLSINYNLGCLDTNKLLVVITGGEPFRQNLTKLIPELRRECFTVQIETNGTFGMRDPFVFADATIVCSPKTGKVNVQIQDRAACYKYVLAHDSMDPRDGLPTLALGHTACPRVARPKRSSMPIYVQPMDAQDDHINALNMAAAVKSCMKFGYTMQLQIHKYLKVP